MKRLTDIEVISGQVHPVPKLSLQNLLGFEKIVERLQDIENILGDDYDLDRLRELVEADKQGRVKIYPKSENSTCGACGHFRRIAGTRRGTCDVKPFATTRRGVSWGYKFVASQSRKACKLYKPAAEATLAKESSK